MIMMMKAAFLKSCRLQMMTWRALVGRRRSGLRAQGVLLTQACLYERERASCCGGRSLEAHKEPGETEIVCSNPSINEDKCRTYLSCLGPIGVRFLGPLSALSEPARCAERRLEASRHRLEATGLVMAAIVAARLPQSGRILARLGLFWSRRRRHPTRPV